MLITASLIPLQYNVFSLVFSWFALANLWLTFSILIDLLPSQNIIIFGTATVVGFFLTLQRDILNSHVDPLGQLGFEMDLLGVPWITSKKSASEKLCIILIHLLVCARSWKST